MKAAFIHEIRHLPVAQRQAQVPTHTHEDDWAFVMPPEERIGRPNGHRFTLPQSDFGFRNTTMIVAPANTPYTSSFGLRRIYNGRTRSVHQGLDYTAALGTQVTAANSGNVEIARDMYFEGGFIVIDHGESIFTLYMHLSEFLVREGAGIDKGDPIAKSGSSGRVTGPHLHFAVRWQGDYLEPSTLLGLWRSGRA